MAQSGRRRRVRADAFPRLGHRGHAGKAGRVDYRLGRGVAALIDDEVGPWWLCTHRLGGDVAQVTRPAYYRNPSSAVRL